MSHLERKLSQKALFLKKHPIRGENTGCEMQGTAQVTWVQMKGQRVGEEPRRHRKAGPEAGGGALTWELSLPAGLKRGPEARRQSGLGQSEPEPMQERGHAGQARGVSNKDLTTDKTGPGTKSTGNKSKQNRQFGLQEN